MGVPAIDTGPMAVEDFVAFVDSRPDNEKWELIEGEPVLNAWPAYRHQRIVTNILRTLLLAEQGQSRWQVLPGLAVRVGASSLPVPDVLVRPNGFIAGRECDDMIVAFEVLSPSTAGRDLRWKRNAYTALPSLTHYVVIAQDTIEAVVCERSVEFKEQRFTSADAVIGFPELAITLRFSEIYRGTELL